MNTDETLRILIGRLSDGEITQEESRQLNELLRQDPAAQLALLDHLAVDGLLEREFGQQTFAVPGVPVSLKSARSRFVIKDGARFLNTGNLQKVAAGLAIGFLLGSLAWWVTHSPVPLSSWKTLTLYGTNFDHAETAAAHDHGNVVGKDEGIHPQDGTGMLRFMGHPEADNAGIIRQVVDLRPYREQIALSPEAIIELSAWFNAVPPPSLAGQYSFALQMSAFRGEQSQADEQWHDRQTQHLTLANIRQVADHNPKSWQRLSAKMAAPVDADYLVFEVRILQDPLTPANTGLPPHYVDSIELKLHTPAPGTIASNP